MRRPATGRVLPAVLIAAALAAACGKRGNPLPPLRPVPARIQDLAAHRTADRVELTFTVPAENADGSTPVAIDRVDIYAVPGTAAGPARSIDQVLADEANRRASIPVRTEEAASAGDGAAVSETGAVAPGARATVVDALAAPAPEAGSTNTASVNYVAVGVVGKRRGAASAVLTVPLAPPPDPPATIEVTSDERDLIVTWPEAAGQQVLVYELPAPAPAGPPSGAAPVSQPPGSAPAGQPSGAAPAGQPSGAAPVGQSSGSPPPGQSSGAAPAAQPSAAVPVRPRRLTAQPLAAARYTEPVEFGRTRCFFVTSVRVSGAVLVEGPPSQSACGTPVDRYPPPAPTSLQAIQEGAAVTVNWAAVEASDLAGYIVLRGDASGENMRPLVRQPIAGTTYSDTTVEAGATYTYSVYAVDTAPVPNVSQQSARQVITVRAPEQRP